MLGGFAGVLGVMAHGFHWLLIERHMTSDPAAEIARRRTFAIISHPDAGKTTLTEKLLLCGGAIQLAGSVRAKGERRRTRSDWMGIERERGISVVDLRDDVRARGLRVQPARHAGPRGLLRGHLSHADRGRLGGDGDRRREGHRGAARASCSRSAGCATSRSRPSSTRWTARAATRSSCSTRSRTRSRSRPRP